MGDARLTMKKEKDSENSSYYVPDFKSFPDPRQGLQLQSNAAKSFLPKYEDEQQAERPWKTFTSHSKREGYYRAIEVDAFSSDAIPIHLITREAIEMYMSKLIKGHEIEEPDPKDSTKKIKRWMSGGVLCVHTSNRHVNLVQPVLGICNETGFKWVVAKDEGGEGRGRGDIDMKEPSENGHFGSEYVLVAWDQRDLPPYTLSEAEMARYKALGARLTYTYQQVDLYKANGVKQFKARGDRILYSSTVDFYGPDSAKDPKVNLVIQPEGRTARPIMDVYGYNPEGARPWTDDYSNVLSVFRW